MARELDVTTDRLMEIALRHGLRFTSNFNAVEPEQEERLRIAVKGPIRVRTKPIVKIVKTAREKQAELEAEQEAEAWAAEEEAAKAKIAKKKEAAASEAAAEVADKDRLEVEGRMDEEVALPERGAVEEKRVEKAEIEERAVEHPAVAAKADAEAEPAAPKRIEGEKAPPKTDPETVVIEPAAVDGERKEAAKLRISVKPGGLTAEEAARRERDRSALHPKRAAKEAAREAAREREREEAKAKRSGLPPRVRQRLEIIEEEEAPLPRRKRRRKKRKERPEEVVAAIPIARKKRAKMPTMPTVDHIMLSEGMTLKELAEKLGIKAKDIVQRLLLEKGMVANINQVLDPETATAIAKNYGVSTEEMTYEEEIALADELKAEGEPVPRAPVVTLMGHVDHGKTTLLDVIRKSSIVAGEHGGITQHIGAYKIDFRDRAIVFLDTPGHEAFTRLRARGAKVTDIVILVVAADDGVMPQTVEAIQHAKAAGVPIIVAVTKTDLPQANLDKVKRGLAEQDILVEGWGGDVVAVEVSGKTGRGVDDLLDMILLVAEMQNLNAYPAVKAVGTVLEARLDRARGPVATVLVQNGTLRVGDFFITGLVTGKVKAMLDDKSARIDEAAPATPVEILGFNEVPDSGDQFQVVDDENKARQMVDYRQTKFRTSQFVQPAKLSLDDLFSRIEEGAVKELPLIIKGDVRGSVEALVDSIEKLSTDKVKVEIKLAQPGAVTESDILLAGTTSAIVIGFNVRPRRTAAQLAEKEGVEIRTYNVIYEVITDVRDAMRGLLEPKFREVVMGKAEVRQSFKIPKAGVVAGCYVTDGEMRRNASVRILREDIVIHEGRVGSLKRFKDDVREVKSGYECGIGIDGFNDIREGDIIEMFVKEEQAAEL